MTNAVLKYLCFLSVILFSHQSAIYASSINDKDFDDTVLDEEVRLPDWFKLSFLDLNEDVLEAQESGKKGLILYFGQNRCPYCKALIEDNFSRKDIVEYMKKNYDVVAIDVFGNRNVRSMSGEILSEKKFAIQKKANFTPTLIFYNHSGNEVHRLAGYYKPYIFRAALKNRLYLIVLLTN